MVAQWIRRCLTNTKIGFDNLFGTGAKWDRGIGPMLGQIF